MPAPPLFFPEPHDNTREPEFVNKRYSDSQFDEPASDYEALVQKWVADYITNAQVRVDQVKNASVIFISTGFCMYFFLQTLVFIVHFLVPQ